MRKLSETFKKRPMLALACVFIAYSIVGTMEYNDATRMGNAHQEQQV